MQSLRSRIRFTIGTKLVGLIALLLMGSIVSLVWLSSRMFVESDTALIQQANADIATSLAIQMHDLFQDVTEKMRILGTVLLQNYNSPQLKDRVVAEFFSKDPDFLGVVVESQTGPGKVPFTLISRAFSPSMASLGDPEGNIALGDLATDPVFTPNLVASGEVQVTSMGLSDGDSALVLAVPFIQDPTNPSHFTHILIAFIKQSRFVKAFAESDTITIFMVDQLGRVLAHADPELVNSHANFSHLGIVSQMLSGKFSNAQTRYVDTKTGEAKLGAFRLVGFAGLGIVAEVLEGKAFKAANQVVYRAALLAWIVLCLSFLLGYLYSGTITWPIQLLADASRRISQGDFKIDLKPKGQDEIADLSIAFNEMAKGLEERDRVKATFNKFHNKEIAEKLLSGEVKLGGERKEATVFFSDVRGFTALSESMEPEQVVEMLNEYMTRMVAIIRSYSGIVDKYVGDAIMAIWGVPITGEEDPYNAVRACLAMREDLAKLNELRISRGQPVIKIGMGLNCGPLIAGNIGSDEKMEYTVIGDAVNLASRIESMTKEFGTDLLVSKSIFQKIENRFIFEKAASTRVKGKTEAVEIFKVAGYYDSENKPILIQTPYSSYAAEKSDKVVHDDKHPAEPLVATAVAIPVHISEEMAQVVPIVNAGPVPPPRPPTLPTLAEARVELPSEPESDPETSAVAKPKVKRNIQW